MGWRRKQTGSDMLGAVTAMLLVASAALASPAPGRPAPAFVGHTLQGDPIDLASLHGHMVVLNMWATWCAPCRAEMPMLDAFYQRHRKDGLALIGLSADSRRDLGAVRKVMQAFSYPAAMLFDAKVNGFGDPDSLPATYVIDDQGVIRAIFRGAPLTDQKLEAAVAPLRRQ